MGSTDVFIDGAADRKVWLSAVHSQYDTSVCPGAEVLLTANCNSADPCLASTHIDALQVLAGSILSARPANLTLAERSGKGPTGVVLEERGVFSLADWPGFSNPCLNEIDRPGWQVVQSPGLYWCRVFSSPGLRRRQTVSSRSPA